MGNITAALDERKMPNPGLKIHDHVARLAETIRGDDAWFSQRGVGPGALDVASLQLIWWWHMIAGDPALGDVVETTIDAFCRSGFDEPPRASGDRLGLADARMLELVTWVWRGRRTGSLRTYATAIADRAANAMMVDFPLVSSGATEETGHAISSRDEIRIVAHGLMLVALLEAGSVFERREWLVAAMRQLDWVIARAGQGDDAARGSAADGFFEQATLEDIAAMCRAALVFFDAFGKARYLAQARLWVAALNDRFWDAAAGCFRDGRFSETSDLEPRSDGNVLMLGVLSRLGAATGEAAFGAQAERLAAAVRHHAAGAGATSMAMSALDALSTPVTIRVSGDPRDADTRSLMRVALDYSLPDRRVLGPGAGGAAEDRLAAAAHVMVGAKPLAPMDEKTLRKFCAPGSIGSTTG